jgi:hypothetical protein
METVAAALGMQARLLPLPEEPDRKAWAQHQRLYLRQAAAVIHQAIQAGEVVIALSGWDFQGPHGFTHWGYAGIVTSADPATGAIAGAHLNGHVANPIIYPPDHMWALSRGPVTLAPVDRERAIVALAVCYIRGQKPFQAEYPAVFGLAAMDAWIEHMETVEGYCAPCFDRGENSWHDALENAERLVRGARIAAARLRSVGEAMEPAAAHYDRIAELLAPALDVEAPTCYKHFIGDLEAQKQHARTVLIPVGEALAAAAEEMERALASSRP